MQDNREKDLQSILSITSNQLDKYYHHKAIENVLKDIDVKLKNNTIDEQIKYYEDQAKNLVEKYELIKSYIFFCAQDRSPFNFHKISQIPDSLESYIKDVRVHNSINEMKSLIKKEIDDSGGYYLYFKINRNAIQEMYPFGVPLIVKYEEKFLFIQKANQDFEVALKSAKTPDEINNITEAYRLKVSNPFPENEMKIEKEIDIPYLIRLFIKLLDKIEELKILSNERYQIKDNENPVKSIFNLPGISLPPSVNKMNIDLSILYENNLISIIEGKPNFPDAKFAIALFDLWNTVYLIFDYDQSRDTIISNNVKIKNRNYPPNTITQSRNRIINNKFEKIIIQHLPHLTPTL